MAEGFATVKERRQRILSSSKRQECNGRIAQLDFGYGCIGDRFTVVIGEANAAFTIVYIGLVNEVIEGITASIGECFASAGREIVTVNDTAVMARRHD